MEGPAEGNARPASTSRIREQQWRGLNRQSACVADRERGLTLVELIITIALLSILASAAVPVTLFTIKRDKEHVLRRDLWEMRDAIDHYKDDADSGAVQIKVDSNGYPPDLETLVNGIDIRGMKVQRSVAQWHGGEGAPDG